MIYGKNIVTNEIDNIDCDKDEDIKRHTGKYINIVTDKLILINAVSDSIDELIELITNGELLKLVNKDKLITYSPLGKVKEKTG